MQEKARPGPNGQGPGLVTRRDGSPVLGGATHSVAPQTERLFIGNWRAVRKYLTVRMRAGSCSEVFTLFRKELPRVIAAPEKASVEWGLHSPTPRAANRH